MENKEPEINCGICLCPAPLSQCLTLACNHRFCKDCLVADWTSNISQGFIDSSRLKCPDAKCTVPISYEELRANLPQNIFQKYEEFSFNAFMVNETNQTKEKTIVCPDPKCQTKSFIWSGASYFTCFQCKVKYCAECRGDWKDHEGMTCEKYKELKEKNLNPNDIVFENMMQNEKWMKCPKCEMVVEKIEFCNFIRCPSNICQKNTCFCYLCGEILTEELHYKHYKDKNPYLNECVNSNKPKNLKNGEKIQEKEKKLLKDACPGCGTKNPEVCEILWEKFTKCSDNKCKFKGKVVCLKCRRKFEANEGEAIFQHGEGCKKKCCRIF